MKGVASIELPLHRKYQAHHYERDTAVFVPLTGTIYAYGAYVLECARRYRTPLLSLDRRQYARGV